MGKKLRFLSLAVLLLLTTVGAMAQNRTVSGKVTSSDGPVPGASVLVTGTTRGASTDADGNYTLELGPSDNSLTFSFIGLKTVTVEVGTRTTIDVSMETDVTSLDEIVVVGYGEQRKADITGSIVSVKGGEISKQASINPISGLQGKVAGVQITNSGAPGSSPQVRIRGLGTVGSGSAPLYVVDNVWYDDISFLNPADIENMSILKDASSQAIYGVRAANGVIIITTKRGLKNSAPSITYDGFVGSQVATNMVDMANGPQFATLINELDATNGVTPRYSDPDSYGSTDWYRQVLRSAMISNHNVGINGGTEKATYNFALGYLYQEGTVETNDFSRYTARLQNDIQATDWFKFGFTASGAYNKSNDIDNGIFHQIYAAAPIVPVYYEDGSYGDPNDFSVGSSNAFNPQATLDFYDQQSRNYRLTGNAYAEAKFLKNFTFRTSWSGDYGQNESNRYAPVYTATLSQRNSISQLTLGRSEDRNWMIENTISYSTQLLEDHNISILVGQSAQHYGYYSVSMRAQNVPNTSDGDHYFDQGNNYFLDDEGKIQNVASFFSRLNYSFREKYLLTATYRLDALSDFIGDDRNGHFPSIGLGWVISEEGFMKNQTFLSNLKLRASWGKNGNNAVRRQLAVQNTTLYPFAVFGPTNNVYGIGQSIATQVPPSVSWEKAVGTDIGLELGFLNNKLTVELDWYNKKTEDAIFPIVILRHLGTSSGNIEGNQATIENTGFEFQASWNDNITDDLTFSIGANFAINKNKVTEVLGGDIPYYGAGGTTGGAFNTRTVLGQPIGQFFGYKVVGIFQTDEDIDEYVSSDGDIIQPTAQPGDFKYKDLNDDGVIDAKDRTIIGNPNPKFLFGINTTWNWRNFDFTLDMQGVMGVDVYNAELGYRFGTENFTKDFYDNRWHGEGTSNSYPSANIGGGTNYMANDFYVESGSYFRFRNIQLGYTLPSTMTERIKIRSIRIYANAQNALTIFKYRGFNPEVGGNNPILQGIDVNTYPLFATYNLGLNVKF